MVYSADSVSHLAYSLTYSLCITTKSGKKTKDTFSLAGRPVVSGHRQQHELPFRDGDVVV